MKNVVIFATLDVAEIVEMGLLHNGEEKYHISITDIDVGPPSLVVLNADIFFIEYNEIKMQNFASFLSTCLELGFSKQESQVPEFNIIYNTGVKENPKSLQELINRSKASYLVDLVSMELDKKTESFLHSALRSAKPVEVTTAVITIERQKAAVYTGTSHTEPNPAIGNIL